MTSDGLIICSASSIASGFIVRVALAAAALYFFASRASLLKVYATGRDSIQYWAAGRLLLHRGNPYDVTALFDLQAQQGLTGTPAC